MTESNNASKPNDVRMRGFQYRTEVADVYRLLEEKIRCLSPEPVSLEQAAGRVLAEDVTAEVNVPSFYRAAMDGYALKGAESFGADPYNPLEFAVIGQSLPARPFGGTVQSGHAVRIMTGSPVPDGADAVVKAEDTELMSATQTQTERIRVTDSVPPGRHVARPGEDIQAGSVVLRKGRLLRPQDVGVLASIGVSPIQVIRRPTAALFVTGDELLPPGSKPEGFRIVDSNSVMLQALVQRDGGIWHCVVRLKDDYESVHQALSQADEDVLLVSGGSSVGIEDHAPKVVAELGELPVHGVALRPASPAGVGFIAGRPVFLLPGNPVSCLCAYDLFAGSCIRRMGGRSKELPYLCRSLPLARKISSVVGRVDYVRIQIKDEQIEPLAISGASILSSTTRSDGFVIVPAELEGYAPGERVNTYLYDVVLSNTPGLDSTHLS